MGYLRIGLGAVLVGANAWLAESVFEPVAPSGQAAEFILVCAPLLHLLIAIVISAAALLALQTVVARRQGGSPESWATRANTDHLSVLGWLWLSLVPLVDLVSPLARALPPFSYVFFELRWYWWAVVAVAMAMRLRRGIGPARPRPGRGATTALVASLVVIPVAWAVIFTPNLRFSGVLHGDEPKYLRFCEAFYQGLGFDMSAKKSLVERSGHDEPRAFNNVRELWSVVPEEARLLADDLARVFGRPGPRRLAAGEPSPQMFFAGKHPGTVYQLHNPGLSFLLFPGYYLDRRLTGSGLGYQNEFPYEMPAVYATLLALYGGFVLALYGLLRRYTGGYIHCWGLALLGSLVMPAGAFAFQIYPEVAAGLILFVLIRRLLTLTPAGAASSAAYGALAGFLPWLHVRFGLVTIVLLAWWLVARQFSRRGRWFFSAGAALVLAALSLYTYRLTGSLLPIATYGADAPLSVARAARGLPGFAIDRIWGLIPHAPIYLVALPGIGLAWRRRAAGTGWLLALLAASVIPAAGHGFWAGGSTPGRYLVACVPLLLLFVAEALSAWSKRRVFLAVFLTLVLVSLETAVQYNLHHAKEIGPLVAPGLSGWRIGLLFPSLGTETWTATSTDIVLLVAWSVIAVGLLCLPWWLDRPRAKATASPRGPGRPRVLRDLLTSLGLLAVGASCVGLATGRTSASEYQVSAKTAREHALEAFAAMPQCALCYSSAAGSVEPTVALGNDVTLVDMRIDRANVLVGERVRLRARPRTSAGGYVLGTTRVDFGDGTVSEHLRVFGDIEEVHVYTTPGEYQIQARCTATSGQPAQGRLTLRVGSR